MTRREELHANEDTAPTLRAQSEVGAGERGQQIAAVGRLGQQLGAGRGQQLTAESEFSGAMAVGQETVVADALETRRNYMLQEAADELLGRYGHHLGFTCVAGILPGEGKSTVFQSQEGPVGDGGGIDPKGG